MSGAAGSPPSGSAACPWKPNKRELVAQLSEMAVVGCCRQQQQALDTLVVAQQGCQQAVAVTAFTASTQVVRFVHYYQVEAGVTSPPTPSPRHP